MHEMTLPILYSYRRCPYAMRARMALFYAGIQVEIREISLRDKPAHMLAVSPKGTVPVLCLPDGLVIEQSLDIMYWALHQSDRDGWLSSDQELIETLIRENDGAFKQALDRYKYPERYPEQVQEMHRKQGEFFLSKLESLLVRSRNLLGNHPSIADVAIFPFVRQFAAVDSAWFEASEYLKLNAWLLSWTSSELFQKVMQKTSK